MLIAALLAVTTLGTGATPAQPAVAAPPARAVAAAGAYAWHDEFDNVSLWTLPGSVNDPVVSVETPGVMTLTMPQVPVGYPFAFQWGAVSRTIAVDTDATTLLTAYVSRVSDGGYAHIEAETRDYSGNVVKSARSHAVQGRGLVTINLRDEFGTGLLRLTVRLIVGGPNSGAWCDYDFLRALRPEQFTTLQNQLTRPTPTTTKAKARAHRTH